MTLTINFPVLRHLVLVVHAPDEPMYWSETHQTFFYKGEEPVFDMVAVSGPEPAVRILLGRLSEAGGYK